MYPTPTCGECGRELSDDEVDEFWQAPESERLGRLYCRAHLQPALDGEYLVRVVVPSDEE